MRIGDRRPMERWPQGLAGRGCSSVPLARWPLVTEPSGSAANCDEHTIRRAQGPFSSDEPYLAEDMPRTLAATRQIVVRRRDVASLAPPRAAWSAALRPGPGFRRRGMRPSALHRYLIGRPRHEGGSRTSPPRSADPDGAHADQSDDRQVLKGSHRAPPARPSFNRPTTTADDRRQNLT